MSFDSLFVLSFGGAAGREPDALRVASFRGRERVSKPYAWDVVVTGRDIDDAAFLSEAPGQAVRLVIHGPAGSRAVCGVVARIALAGTQLQGRTAYKLRIVPRFATLRHRRNSRIFQEMTTPEMVSAVLDEAGVLHRSELRHRYAARVYGVQYEETDFDFVHRLLAESGIFYRFEHPGEEAPPDAPETLVLGDRAEHRAIDGDPRLLHRVAQAGGALELAENHVTGFQVVKSLAPRSIARRDYDFRRPLVLLDAGAKAGGPLVPPLGPGEIYEHHGAFEEAEAEDGLETAALEQLRRKAQTAGGESTCVRLLPGRRFRLEEHLLGELDGDYLVTGVDHEGRSPEVAGAGARAYENRFTCVRASTVLRPRRRARESRQVVETAVVTGPSGQEIYTDAHGRIKVQFHWDRYGQKNERSSCWIRVAQSWAGTGWGFQFIPRIGMEVLVTFLGGDPDRPMVTGCVPNATHPPPYPLPESKTTSGIKTESTPGGGGYNEIAFEDRRDAEQLRVRAQRNMQVDVLQDEDTTVGRDRRVAVGQTHTESVGSHRTVSVGGDERRSVARSEHVAIAGAQETEVGAGRTTRIGGDEDVMVRGGVSMSTGAGFTLAATGELGLIAGTKKAPADITAFAWGAVRLVGGSSFSVRTDGKIVLETGKSRIEIGPERITLESPEVVLLGEKTLSLFGKDEKGPALHLTDDVELVAKSIKLLAKDASIELAENADVRGKLVRLNCGKAPKPSSAEGESAQEETKPFRVTLANAELEPYANKHFELVAAGHSQEGKTGGGGEIDVQVPKDARAVQITVWVDEYPTGARLKWAVTIAEELPAASTIEGLLIRLKNLGYERGTDTEELDEETQEGLRHFQRDHELAATGELDEATAQAVEKAHGG